MARRGRGEAALRALQFFSGLKTYRLAGLDGDLLSGAGIAANAGLARFDIEHPKASQLNPLASRERLFHGVKNSLDGFFRLGLGDSGTIHDLIHEVKLNHANLLALGNFILKAAFPIVKLALLNYDSTISACGLILGLGRPGPCFLVEVKPMSVKSDRWIRRMVKEHEMIHPFAESQVREGVISYGLSSYGYDLRVAEEFKIFTNVNSTIVDPKHFDERSFVEFRGPVCIVPPNSFALARSVEYFKIPRHVLTICVGKSTYARCGIIVNVTPLEPEWEGFVTLEISNTTPLPARVYSNEGLCQIVFFDSDEVCETSYKDKKGKYQAQQGIVLPRI